MALSPQERQGIIEEEKLRKELRNKFSWSRVVWLFVILIVIGAVISAIGG
tara:strand:- start:89 stop:238 length:150 start_codon:yes stop_codon:yes gene_type:complete